MGRFEIIDRNLELVLNGVHSRSNDLREVEFLLGQVLIS